MGGRVEPLSHVALLCWRGRELDIVSQAELIEPWRRLHEDLNCLSQGLALVEAAEQVAQEREAAEPLYRMLVGALRTLVSQPGPLVVASRTPCSTAGIHCLGTTPPVIRWANWKPSPRFSGLISTITSPNWPWPPVCFLWRACWVTAPVMVSL